MDFDLQIIIRNSDAILLGFRWTLTMVIASLIMGIALGLLVCFAKLMAKGALHRLAVGYIEFYRTIPEMVNIFWIYYCLPLILDIRLNSVTAGLIAMTLYAGAFLAEIFRAGINSVPDGQIEAGYSCGLSWMTIWWSIVLPQAFRTMVPAFITFISDLVKVSGLLSAIGVTELVYQATVKSNDSWKHFEFFTAVGLLYLLMITPLSLASQYVERRQARLRR